jgi:glutamate-1-semialdehyde 2,1-aminomutase
MGGDPQEVFRSRTSRSKALYGEASELLPGGLDSNLRAMYPYPFFVEGAKGVHLLDVDGNRYIDFLLGQGSLVHGHAHPSIRAALEEQLGRAGLTTLPSPLSLELAREVRRRVPSVERIRYTASGTEATMVALRLARAFTGRDAVAKAEGAYHGGHDGLLWSFYRYGPPLGPPGAPEPFPHGLGLPRNAAETIVVFQYNDLEGTEAVLRRNAGRLAAVIVEPILGNAGVLPPEEGYLQGLARTCRDLGILLVFDEVMTGFRVAPGGAQERYGVRPDLTTFGKILGGGLPQGAIGGRREVMELLGPGDPETRAFHGGTNAGHPLAMATGLAALRLLDGAAYRGLEDMGALMFRGLQEAADAAGVPTRVKWVGPVGHVHFTQEDVRTGRDGLAKGDWLRLGRWGLECINRGVLFGHPLGEKIFLSTVHSPGDVEEALAAASQAFKAVAKG